MGLIDLHKIKEQADAKTAHPTIGEPYEGHDVYLSQRYEEFANQLPQLRQGWCYDFVSLGSWSMKEVVFHLLKMIGPAKLWATTYGLGPSSARALVKGLDSGLIESCTFVYDSKIKQERTEAHDILAERIKVKVMPMHAKIAVLLNEEWGVVVSGSANWSDTNSRVELNTVFVNRAKAVQLSQLIETISNSESYTPQEVLNDLQPLLRH